MIREVDLVSYLPPYLRKYKEQNNVLTVENPEFVIVWDAANRVLNNEFIATADEYGISRYEKILGVLPFVEDTIESRRARVQSRWFTSIPYTMKSLLAKLIALCGENNFTVKKQFSIYHIYIDVRLELLGQVEELERMLQIMIPCNIVVNTQNVIDCEASSALYLAGGVADAVIIFVTNDFIENHEVGTMEHFAVGITITEIIATD